MQFLYDKNQSVSSSVGIFLDSNQFCILPFNTDVYPLHVIDIRYPCMARVNGGVFVLNKTPPLSDGAVECRRGQKFQ